ncbi:MAG: TIGR03564 family F420-dependent LLM class oxidoreductase [Acidimicrobiales bacterium]
MRIGTTMGLDLDGPQTFEDIASEANAARAAGFRQLWSAQLFSWDALTLLGALGGRVPDVGFGTAVVATYPRHPLMLASQALTVQAATGNRLTLGLGPSHQVIVEGSFGLGFDRPGRHVREYLTALIPLLHGETIDYRGETLSAVGAVGVTGAAPPPVLVAALGPALLRIAGELVEGTIVTWTGPKALSSHVVPRITAAAEAAGRPPPRVVVSLPVTVTADEQAARDRVADSLGQASDLPSYRAMLRAGAAS